MWLASITLLNMLNLINLPRVALNFLRIEGVFWEFVAVSIIKAILRVYLAICMKGNSND